MTAPKNPDEKTERAVVEDPDAEQRSEDAVTEPTPLPAPKGGRLVDGAVEDGIATPDEQRQASIDALLRERRGYVQRVAGATEDKVAAKYERRLKDVDAELKKLGHKG